MEYWNDACRRHVRALLAHLAARQGEPGAERAGGGRRAARPGAGRPQVFQPAARPCHAAAGLAGGAARAAGEGAPGDEQARAGVAVPAHHPRHGDGDQRRLPHPGHLRAVRRRRAQGEGATPHHRYVRIKRTILINFSLSTSYLRTYYRIQLSYVLCSIYV